MARPRSLLDTLPSPQAVRRRLAELDRERSALLVILQATEQVNGGTQANKQASPNDSCAREERQAVHA
jgi:hypothetical protein